MDNYSRHEALDRTHCILNAFCENIIEHNYIQNDPDLLKKCKNIANELSDLYQTIGKEHFKNEDDYIERDLSIKNGIPMIKRSGVSVDELVEQVIYDFPELTIEEIAAAFAYTIERGE